MAPAIPKRRFAASSAMLFALLLAGAAGAQTRPAPQQPAPLRVLGVELPAALGADAAGRRAVDELNRERCDQTAIQNLGDALQRVGYRRDAANVHLAFSRACGGHPVSVRRAVNFLLNLGDNDAAVSAADELIALEPFGDNGYYLRALAHDRAGRAQRAIDDYINAIELFGDKTRISNVSYLAMARNHERLGRPCDGIGPIEQWVSYNPAVRDNSQTRAIVAGYMAKGDCAARAVSNVDRIPVDRASGLATVAATVNGTRGNFIVDTGASFLTLTKAFADRAKIAMESDGTIKLHTANGTVQGQRGRADIVKLSRSEARDVVVVVQSTASSQGFVPGIDGLLGMSFLSHFDVNVAAGAVTIGPRGARR